MSENPSQGTENENERKIPYGLFFVFLGALLISYVFFAYGKNIEGISLTVDIALPVLFALGLITGLHCLGMCGSFVVAYSSKEGVENKENKSSHLEYGAGKLISYTLMGAVFGLIGSVISFTPELRGSIGVLAGVFLIIYGLNMLNIFPVLRKLQPRFPSFANFEKMQKGGPFRIGLANGLFLACGPLQAMYIYAAGTGSPVNGALALFAFGLGTLPLMMIFGFGLSAIVKHVHKIMKFSGALVIVLGLIMANTGLTLLGKGIDLFPQPADESTLTNSSSSGQVQEIRMSVNGADWFPDTFNLQKGIKVRWVIDAVKLSSCGDEMIFPNYAQYMKIEGTLPDNMWVKENTLHIKPNLGENTFEFTPVAAGTWRWSCWMGMIPGTFIIK